MNSNEPILKVENLTSKLQLGNSTFKVVDGITFSLLPGKTLALVGESGSGKSMTALSLLRIAPSPPALPPEGKIIFNQKDLTQLRESEIRQIRGGKISMIFQDPSSSLNPVYTIGNQLIESAMLHLNVDEEEAFAISVEGLKAVGIASPVERMENYPHQLSGGMNQRVMIAMALIGKPEILIADEPTTALDVTMQAQVIELLKSLQEKYQMAILLITHDLGVVAEIAQEVAVMYAGTIVEQGTVEQVFKNPSHPYTVGLFQSLDRTGKEKGKLQTIKGSVPSLQHIPAGCPFHPRCPYAFEKCYHGKVPPFVIDNFPKHTARCWLNESKSETL